MRARSCLLVGLLAGPILLAATPAFASPDVEGTFSIGSGGTDHKPQSKLWFNDGAWWAIVYDDDTGQRIWKFENGLFAKETYPGALVDSRRSARADVLWDGTHLFVLMWHNTTPRFYKYSYDSTTQEYALLAGFPVDLAIPDTEVMSFDKDSTGRVWASYELDLDIHVIWTTTPDHLNWNTTGIVIGSGVNDDDITNTVAFDGDKIGVMWSDQGSEATWIYGFRIHQDGDPPETWQGLEVIDTGNLVDDHLNTAVDSQGRIYLATKDVYNRIHLYVRGTSGGWSHAASNINDGSGTRPIVMVDESEEEVHVLYTTWETDPYSIAIATASTNSLNFGSPSTFLASATSNLNDITGTKQTLSMATGFMALASSGSNAYWGFNNLDDKKPDADGLYPYDEQVGIELEPVLEVRITDEGMGTVRNSIVMTLDGQVVTPSISGNASYYLLSWAPPTPLESGRIYEIRITADDAAYPPNHEFETIRFRTEMDPLPIAYKINFQPQGVTPPSGYQADWGNEYDLDDGSGWNKGTIKGRQANVDPDLRLDTYVDRNNSWGKATYAFDVANGVYLVSLAAGSPSTNGKQRIEVEGDVLLNNQTTAAGQFLTVTDYPAVVQDHKLTLLMGGAGGSSTKTQLCYLEFRYDGPAPPPPPPGGDAEPRAVTGVVVAKSGNDLQLDWNAVTEDTTGTIINVTRYNVYRGTTADFQPDLSGHQNRVGIVAATMFTDIGADNVPGDLFYLVTAERSSGTEGTHASNLGLRRRLEFTPSGGSQTVWLALPYNTAYGTARGLAISMNGGTGSGPVVGLGRLDRGSQSMQRYTYSGGWNGTDFALVPGEAVEITFDTSFSWDLVGSETSSPAYGFDFRTDVGNLRWIALPHNAVYADAQSLAQALNGGAGATPVTKIARLDPLASQMESYLYFAGQWRGTNFTLEPGTGVAVIVDENLSSWVPSLAQP